MNRSSALFCILLITLISFIFSGAEADGNVGCLFQDICIEKIELCYNDGAFGRCVQSTPVEDDLYRYNLNFNDLQKLKIILQNLHSNGFGWKNSYAQCIIQTQLYAIRLGTVFYEEACSHLMLQHNEDPIRQLKELERLHPEDPKGFYNEEDGLKFDGRSDSEKFASSDTWPNYVRPQESSYNSFDETKKQRRFENDLPSQLVALPLSNENYKKRKKSSNFETHPRFSGTPLYMPKHRLMSADGYGDDKSILYGDKIKQGAYGGIDPQNLNRQNKLNSLISRMNGFFQPATTYTEGGPIYLDNSDNGGDFDGNLYERLMNDYDSDMWGFRRSERLDVKKPGPYFKVNNYAFQNMMKDSSNIDGNIESIKKSYNERIDDEKDVIEDVYHQTPDGGPALTNFKNQEYAYVPGTSNNQAGSFIPELSYVFVKTRHGVSNKSAADILDVISSELHIPREVFADPKLNGNELLFKVVPNTYGVSAYGVKRGIDDIKHILKETMNIHIILTGTRNKPIFNMNGKKTNSTEKYNHVDDEDDNNRLLLDGMKVVYIMSLDEKLPSKNSAKQVLRRIEDLLNINQGTFKLLNVDSNEVSFLVDSEDPRLNGANLNETIHSVEGNLRNDNINVRNVEPIDMHSSDNVQASPLQNQRGTLYALAISVCVLLGAAFVSFVAFCFVRRHTRTTDKLKKSATADPEHSKTYQLCRARMAGKPSELSHVGHRITSISRESDNSPSSRSSTSSWSEEPMTNMDITTGHMVLSYMEDHLKNKGRLDTEWAALCVYEAEPCSVSVAQLPENIRKNRYVNALPYDHARVVLNALSNVSGSDYINASTITDHDPRNPAYIATQGPLSTTTIDFWQMIWEQGCVVIVMLTRLVENDVTMCHRYWPQEGSDLYNIYEVHLVSEHIWCDDFLVRSFYLKNLKTTETRTVTQFHFLTWGEGGIPPAIRPLLEFRRKVNKSFRGRSCPIVVHCSDGVGRTGTYLLLDMVLNRISKGAKEIDIAATLEHIRDQRAGAVSTKSQFQFVLAAVAEEVDAVLRAFPQQSQDQIITVTAPGQQSSSLKYKQETSSSFGQQSSSTPSGQHDDVSISRTVIEEEPPVTTETQTSSVEQAKEDKYAGKTTTGQSK